MILPDDDLKDDPDPAAWGAAFAARAWWDGTLPLDAAVVGVWFSWAMTAAMQGGITGLREDLAGSDRKLRRETRLLAAYTAVLAVWAALIAADIAVRIWLPR